MKRIVLAVVVFSVGVVVLVAPSVVAAAPKTAAVTIRHQVKGCHAWSVNGGAFGASQAVTLARGGSIRFTNNDVRRNEPHGRNDDRLLRARRDVRLQDEAR